MTAPHCIYGRVNDCGFFRRIVFNGEQKIGEVRKIQHVVIVKISHPRLNNTYKKVARHWERVGILTRQNKAKTGGGRHDLPTTISYGLVVDLVKNFKANHDHNNNKNETTTCKTKR